jgi:hypothetical protein
MFVEFRVAAAEKLTGAVIAGEPSNGSRVTLNMNTRTGSGAAA